MASPCCAWMIPICGKSPVNWHHRLITYGIDHPADYNAVDIRRHGRQVSFRVVRGEEELGEVTLQVPGRHNVSNALAALIVCMEIGLSFPEAAEALGQFQGAKRRFQLIGEVDGITVVDDYAHHPTEIRATLAGAKAMGKRIVAVFQPQRFSRTYFLMEEFSRAFDQADEVIITDIYSPPGEKPIPGVTSERLAQLVRQNSNPNTLYCPTKEDVVDTLLERIRPGDLIMTMGAGDIWRVAQDLVSKLGERTRVGESDNRSGSLNRNDRRQPWTSKPPICAISLRRKPLYARIFSPLLEERNDFPARLPPSAFLKTMCWCGR